MVIKYFQNTNKSFKKKQVKDIKIFLKKKKDKRRQKGQDRYQNLSEEEKEKKLHYHREPNKNLPEEEKEMKLSI